jgi:hypothetical protein
MTKLKGWLSFGALLMALAFVLAPITNAQVLSTIQKVLFVDATGATMPTGNGTASGAQRVSLASDSTGQVVLATGANTIGALSANQSVNESQINGVTPLMGNGVTGTGSQRVTIASDNTAFTVNAAQSGTWTVQPGNTQNTTAWLVRRNDATNTEVLDACQTVAPTFTPINIASATTTRIIAPTSAKKTYICALSLFSAGTNNVGIVEGTGGTCGTGTAGIYGGTTAATGLNLIAQTGMAWGDGAASIMSTAGTNVDLCLITSAAPQLSGHVKWVAR